MNEENRIPELLSRAIPLQQAGKLEEYNDITANAA